MAIPIQVRSTLRRFTRARVCGRSQKQCLAPSALFRGREYATFEILIPIGLWRRLTECLEGVYLVMISKNKVLLWNWQWAWLSLDFIWKEVMQRGIASCSEILDQIVDGLQLPAGSKIVLVDLMMNRFFVLTQSHWISTSKFISWQVGVCFSSAGFTSSAKQCGRSRRPSWMVVLGWIGISWALSLRTNMTTAGMWFCLACPAWCQGWSCQQLGCACVFHAILRPQMCVSLVPCLVFGSRANNNCVCSSGMVGSFHRSWAKAEDPSSFQWSQTNTGGLVSQGRCFGEPCTVRRSYIFIAFCTTASILRVYFQDLPGRFFLWLMFLFSHDSSLQDPLYYLSAKDSGCTCRVTSHWLRRAWRADWKGLESLQWQVGPYLARRRRDITSCRSPDWWNWIPYSSCPFAVPTGLRWDRETHWCEQRVHLSRGGSGSHGNPHGEICHAMWCYSIFQLETFLSSWGLVFFVGMIIPFQGFLQVVQSRARMLLAFTYGSGVTSSCTWSTQEMLSAHWALASSLALTQELSARWWVPMHVARRMSCTFVSSWTVTPWSMRRLPCRWPISFVIWLASGESSTSRCRTTTWNLLRRHGKSPCSPLLVEAFWWW